MQSKIYNTSKTLTIKKQTMTTINKSVKEAVINAANKLLKANNTVSTLELKLALRKSQPLFYWNQKLVSDTMNELYQENKFTYEDNGTFRVYSAPVKAAIKVTTTYVPSVKDAFNYSVSNSTRGLVKGSATALAAGAKAAATRAANKKAVNNSVVTKTFTKTPITQTKTKNVPRKAISRSKALDLIKGNKGKIFSATFIKKDGAARVINAQYLKDQKDMSLGYVKVVDTNLRRKNPLDCTRNLNLQTMTQLNVGGEHYKIK